MFLACWGSILQLLSALFSLFSLVACNKVYAPEANIHKPSGSPIITSDSMPSNSIKDSTYCLSKLLNRDVTDIQLTILDNAVTGLMNRLLYEKDSARSTLQGSKNAIGE